MTEPQVKDVVKTVVGLLVKGEYAELEKLTGGRRLTADEIRRAIHQYPGQIVMPPAESFDDLDVVQIEDPLPQPEFSVRFDLWTNEEGKSDLNLELIVVERGGEPSVEITGIHVL